MESAILIPQWVVLIFMIKCGSNDISEPSSLFVSSITFIRSNALSLNTHLAARNWLFNLLFVTALSMEEVKNAIHQAHV